MNDDLEALFMRIANAIIDDISLPDTEIGAAFFHEWEY